ncbi:hypothetical protein EDB92DRAFT_1459136 [Lactarius akahatsu]|uniref:Uncharacterized protein n=1 Tax=Lactarius akahatsu TaxID=416441 RepID=A0AAD4L9W8_9AGAM|nr:hypothetical protein EDB92DRAFT_1459136 [Lactarius akahatsu]
MMSLSVSSFPEAHSRLTTNPTWGEGSFSITKRWFFGGRLNTGGVSIMKGIRHIGKVQLKSSVARRAPKPQPQNSSPPLPPRFSVRPSTIVIDIIAVPRDDGRQSFTGINHDASIPSPIPWPRWRAVPLLVSNSQPRAISSGAASGGAASATAQQPAIRVDSEAARAAREGPSWQPESEETGPVTDHPIVILTPADGSDITHVLLRGDSNLLRCETRTTTRKRSLSSPSGKHMGSRTRDLSQPTPPSTLPLLSSMHIARLRSGSRPTQTPLPPLLAATERRPKTAPTARATKPIPPMPLRRPTGTREGDGDGNGSPPNMSRSRSQPQLRTAATVTGAPRAKAADEQPMPSRFRAGSPTISAKTPGALRELKPCIKQRNAPAVRASPQGEERRPRTAPETWYAARPLAPVGGTDHGAAWEMRGMGVAAARQQAARPQMPYGLRPF